MERVVPDLFVRYLRACGRENFILVFHDDLDSAFFARRDERDKSTATLPDFGRI